MIEACSRSASLRSAGLPERGGRAAGPQEAQAAAAPAGALLPDRYATVTLPLLLLSTFSVMLPLRCRYVAVIVPLLYRCPLPLSLAVRHTHRYTADALFARAVTRTVTPQAPSSFGLLGRRRSSDRVSAESDERLTAERRTAERSTATTAERSTVAPPERYTVAPDTDERRGSSESTLVGDSAPDGGARGEASGATETVNVPQLLRKLLDRCGRCSSCGVAGVTGVATRAWQSRHVCNRCRLGCSTAPS